MDPDGSLRIFHTELSLCAEEVQSKHKVCGLVECLTFCSGTSNRDSLWSGFESLGCRYVTRNVRWNHHGRFLQRFRNFDSLQANVAKGLKEHSFSRPSRADAHVMVVLSRP